MSWALAEMRCKGTEKVSKMETFTIKHCKTTIYGKTTGNNNGVKQQGITTL